MEGWIIGIAVGVVVLFAAWWFRNKRRAARLEQVKEMQYLLDRVAETASKRKTELYGALDGKDNQALQALLKAAESSPVNISDELAQLEALWNGLNEHLDEFSGQSVQSTLRSTVVTSKAAQISVQIDQLVSSIKEKLVA